MIIGTAGHIDHGKTALVRALTGVDTDRLPEEKRRGITIELGFAPLVLEGIGTVGVVDVPGHEGFVRTMVAGATGVDVALLIVAADEGVMPQTREHLTIVTLLGVGSLVVALTKVDLVDAEWLALVRDDVAVLLAETPYEGSLIIGTSIRDGRGLDELRQAMASYARRKSVRSDDDLFRMPVDRAFTVKGTGTVVTGTVWSGRVSEGESVRVHPLDRVVRVRGIQSHGVSVGSAGPGERAAVALAAVDLEEVPRGSQLVSEAPWRTSRLIHAQIFREAGAAAWRGREWLRLHAGTAEVGARVVMPPGDTNGAISGVARVVIDSLLLLRAGDRFVLRRAQPLSTVGGGVVTDPTPPRRRSRPVITSEYTPRERLRQIVAQSDGGGVELEDLPIRLGVPRASVALLVGSEESVELLGSRLYLKSFLEENSEHVVNAVVTYHTSHPLAAGLAPASVGLAATGDRLAYELIERLAGAGRIEIVDGLLRAPGWRPRASGRDEVHQVWLQRTLVDAGREPPSVAEMRAGIEGRDPIPFLRILERDGLVVQVKPGRFYDTGTVAGMMQQLRDGMKDGANYTPAQLRELLGVSRKYLMPFLEYCDRRHVTERRENGRVLGRQEAR